MKIGIIIPSTSHKRNWKTYKESYLFKHTIKSFLTTYDKEHEYIFYIGIDKGDKVYDDDKNKNAFTRFVGIMKNTSLQFHYMENIEKGHLTKMWNALFKIAYDDGCDFFFQCGDDIEFKTKGWVNNCIQVLQSRRNVGVTGPINNNSKIITQSFVSRKHMECFNYYFPPEIINWFCDDWINEIYKRINHFYPLKQHYCANVGGAERYDVNNDKSFNPVKPDPVKFQFLRSHCMSIVSRDLKKYKTQPPCVVCGNGSSLKGLDFTTIKGDTIGTCLAFRHWEKIDWYPTHYVNADHVVLRSNIDTIKDMVENKKCETFLLRSSVLSYWPEAKNHSSVFFLDELKKDRTSIFSKQREICSGASAALYAVHLGHSDVRLIGMDCDYVEFIPECVPKNGALYITETPTHNPNYFIDDYQRKGDMYNIPNGSRVHMTSWKELSELCKQYPNLTMRNYNFKESLGSLFEKKELSEVGH